MTDVPPGGRGSGWGCLILIAAVALLWAVTIAALWYRAMGR